MLVSEGQDWCEPENPVEGEIQWENHGNSSPQIICKMGDFPSPGLIKNMVFTWTFGQTYSYVDQAIALVPCDRCEAQRFFSLQVLDPMRERCLGGFKDFKMLAKKKFTLYQMMLQQMWLPQICRGS